MLEFGHRQEDLKTMVCIGALTDLNRPVDLFAIVTAVRGREARRRGRTQTVLQEVGSVSIPTLQRIDLSLRILNRRYSRSEDQRRSATRYVLPIVRSVLRVSSQYPICELGSRGSRRLRQTASAVSEMPGRPPSSLMLQIMPSTVRDARRT